MRLRRQLEVSEVLSRAVVGSGVDNIVDSLQGGPARAIRQLQEIAARDAR
jgi:hypothetical protein